MPALTGLVGWDVRGYVASGASAHVFVVERDGSKAILKCARAHRPAEALEARFRAEASALRALAGRCAPRLLDDGHVDGRPYLVMEHCAGPTLGAWMSRHGDRGGLGEILGILSQLASALAAIRGAAIVHGDLKPENIVIGPDGVRVVDFGSSTTGGAATPPAGGTAHYQSPEQLKPGTTVDHRTDIYSFGVIAFEMLVGRPPFAGDRSAIEYHHRLTAPPSAKQSRDIPDELDGLVSACMAKDPDARPQSAADVRDWLARAGAAGTERGVGDPKRVAGARGPVGLLWIERPDSVAVSATVVERGGSVVRQRGDAILAAFTWLDHRLPAAAALAAARELGTARSVVHLGSALVRRSARGRVSIYGDDVDRAERWIPARPFTGVVVTAAATAALPDTLDPDAELHGFMRLRRRTRSTHARVASPSCFVGRETLADGIVAICRAAIANLEPVEIAVDGPPGIGKTRLVAEVTGALGDLRVIRRRARQTRLGEPRVDDPRVIAALDTLHVVVVLDDAQWCSPAVHAQIDRVLAKPSAGIAVIRVGRGVTQTSNRCIAIHLDPLGPADAAALLRDMLRPANLLPDVLVDRLVIRAGGNPRMLVALATEIMRSDAIRTSGDDRYIDADALDTLLVAPSAAWFATRMIEDLPPAVGSVARACAALGTSFTAEQVEIATGKTAISHLAALVDAGVLWVDDGIYAFDDPEVHDALFDGRHAPAPRPRV